MKKAVDIFEDSSERKFRIGTRFMNSSNQVFQYAKIDFGIVGKTGKGKVLRNIRYRWIRVK